MRLTMRTRKELTAQFAQRYRTSDKKTKHLLLDEFVSATGYNRKYGIRLLNRWGKVTYVLLENQLLRLQAGHWKKRPPQVAKRI